MSKVQVTLSFDSYPEAIDVLARLSGEERGKAKAAMANDVGAPSAGKSAKTATGAASTPPATPAVPTSVPAAPAPAATTPAPQPSPPPAAAAAVVSYATSGAPELIQKLQLAGKVPELKALLAEFGVAKGPQLKAEQVEPFKARLEAMLAGDGDLS